MNLVKIDSRYYNSKYITSINVEVGSFLRLITDNEVMVAEYDDDGFVDIFNNAYRWSDVYSESSLEEFIRVRRTNK